MSQTDAPYMMNLETKSGIDLAAETEKKKQRATSGRYKKTPTKLSSTKAKWVIRIILKWYSSAHLPKERINK